MDVTVSLPLAFLAGLVSFLSPCVLPVVPSYLAFVTGLTLGELKEGTTARARRSAAVHSLLFVAGFTLIFLTMGWTATAFGRAISDALPWLNRIGGVALIVLGLYLAGWLPIAALAREFRVQLRDRPTGPLGSMAVGMAFGAGWTPCIGPVLASILLYVGLDTTRPDGVLLLGAYSVGLGIPFVAAAVAFNWYLAGVQRVRRWIVPLSRAAGVILVVVGVSMLTGSFARLTAYLAGMGQLINLGTP